MGQVKVRELDDWIVGVHRDLALKSGQSLEQHLRQILKDAALQAQRDFAHQAADRLVASSRQGEISEIVETILRAPREDI